jgi:hypothetical protein
MKTWTKQWSEPWPLAQWRSLPQPRRFAHRDHRDRDNDGISAGEVIAGALVIGGIAAIAAAADRSQ